MPPNWSLQPCLYLWPRWIILGIHNPQNSLQFSICLYLWLCLLVRLNLPIFFEVKTQDKNEFFIIHYALKTEQCTYLFIYWFILSLGIIFVVWSYVVDIFKLVNSKLILGVAIIVAILVSSFCGLINEKIG